jgi:desulfoferrodoxin (superoxide reductase-like protein)
MKLYVCPVCGNLILSSGEAVVSCCGIVLPALEAEPEDETHHINFEKVEDEYYVTILHDMSKRHYISFIMALKDDGYEIKKIYPEGNAEARFKISRTKSILFYCNKHGLFKASVRCS